MLVGRCRKIPTRHMHRVENIPFKMLFSALETSVWQTDHKRKASVWALKGVDAPSDDSGGLQVLIILNRRLPCLWDMTYDVFTSFFSDFADQSHGSGFAICFVQACGLPAARWQRARDYAGKGQHLCSSDHLTAEARGYVVTAVSTALFKCCWS